MTVTIVSCFSIWVGIYTGALARAYWRVGNRRAGVGAGILAVAAMFMPPIFQMFLSTF